jgi:hypothetical protein
MPESTIAIRKAAARAAGRPRAADQPWLSRRGITRRRVGEHPNTGIQRHTRGADYFVLERRRAAKYDERSARLLYRPREPPRRDREGG